jgi:serine/threonine protein kinase
MKRQSECPSCGKLVPSDSAFCASCGAPVATALLNARTMGAKPPKGRKKKGNAEQEQPGVATERMSGPPGHDLHPAPKGSSQGRIMLEALRRATIGQYEIIAELGRGGMATVYLAHDVALDRKVAIKVMSPALLDGEGAVDRFKREARTAGALSHPHIIPIHAVKEDEDLLYFVMKYVEGKPLDAVIAKHHKLPIPMVVQILFEVAGALAHAHRKGVIHRDVKPANIMLDDDGWAVVTDFGIAKVVQEQGLTMTGTTVGTPAYMSPEQCMARDVTGQSDQYSLGVVAFQMLTGRVPFAAESLMEMFLAQMNYRPDSIMAERPDCPPRLAEIVERMMAKSPEDRWPSLDDAVAALGPLHQADTRERTRASMSDLAREPDGRVRADDFARPVSPTPVNVPKRASERAAASASLLPDVERPKGRVPWWILPAILIPIVGGLMWLASQNRP